MPAKSTSSSSSEKKPAARKATTASAVSAKSKATTVRKKTVSEEGEEKKASAKTSRAKTAKETSTPEIERSALEEVIETQTETELKTTPAAAPEPAPAPAAIEVPVAPVPQAPEDPKFINLKPPIVVKELAEKLNLKSFQLIHRLQELNVFATLTQTIEEEVAKKICIKLGFTLEVEKREKGAGVVHAPVKVVEPPKPVAPKVEELAHRPPVITFMGHVDHGKTSLMDCVRKTKVAEGEAGGITQHIGAYTVVRNGQPITFLDTPGHQAFTAMRARGASITDIIVLVVAADDGLMPQTLEAISHAKAAKAPIIVAINKIDLPGANVMKVKGQLQEKGLVPEDFGGDVICCEVSALKKIGIDHLLDMIILQSEVLELKSNPKGSARGRVIEAQSEVGRGPTATMIVQTGTLFLGDAMLVGPFYGRVRALVNDAGQNVKEAGPSVPVKVLGLDGVPSPGDEFVIMKNEKEAREIAEERRQKNRLQKLESGPKVTLENLFQTLEDGNRKTLNLILRGDTQGSLEAIIGSLKNIDSKKVDMEVIQSSVGPITESDILLAKASKAIVVGFNTKTENSAANAAKREEVQIKLYSIIYELIDQMKEAMAGLLDPELREGKLGHAIIKQVFELTKYTVAGCMVQNGRLVRSARARVLRKGQPVYDGGFQTLKRFQDEVGEVRSGLECGIRLGDYNDYQEGDIIECYQFEKIAQTL
jgi:translation initiation factor IF-2